MPLQIFSVLVQLFSSWISINFDRWITSVGAVVPEIYPESGSNKKMESLILNFGRAYWYAIGGENESKDQVTLA